MATTPPLPCGDHTLVLRCPHCGLCCEVSVYLDTRVTTDHKGGTLRATLAASSVEHSCGQPRLVAVDGTALPDDPQGYTDQPLPFDPPDPPEPTDDRPLDYRELAGLARD